MKNQFEPGLNSLEQILPGYPVFKSPFLPIHKIIFVKRPKNLSATSSLYVEQNLVHLDRSMQLGQKVFRVTLMMNCILLFKLDPLSATTHAVNTL